MSAVFQGLVRDHGKLIACNIVSEVAWSLAGVPVEHWDSVSVRFRKRSNAFEIAVNDTGRNHIVLMPSHLCTDAAIDVRTAEEQIGKVASLLLGGKQPESKVRNIEDWAYCDEDGPYDWRVDPL